MKRKRIRWFASDNNAGVHPDVMLALEKANVGHAIGYGNDPLTKKAKLAFRKLFGNAKVFFVFAGTPANVLGLQTMARPYNAIICSSVAHMHGSECGGSEKHIGCKVFPVQTTDGKITVKDLAQFTGEVGNPHSAQPKVVSLTQPTECGTLYNVDEIRAIATYAHDQGWLVHMDGARIANAAAALKRHPYDITGGAGVDVLSFGGTKNGMMYGEAVIFFNTALAKNFGYVRMQGMQLASKMRFIASQFLALLTDDLWLRNAQHANSMAQALRDELATIPNVEFTQPVQANSIFIKIPKAIIAALRKKYFFYVWNEETGEIRLVTSFDTTEEDITGFCSSLEELLAEIE